MYGMGPLASPVQAGSSGMQQNVIDLTVNSDEEHENELDGPRVVSNESSDSEVEVIG
jgi:hypothetical protein